MGIDDNPRTDDIATVEIVEFKLFHQHFADYGDHYQHCYQSISRKQAECAQDIKPVQHSRISRIIDDFRIVQCQHDRNTNRDRNRVD